MMSAYRLRDKQCLSAKAGERSYKLFDGGGLHLVVYPTGGKVWRIAYRFDGKPKTLSLGAYPDTTLASAREQLADVRKMLRNNVDPMAGRKIDKATIKDTVTLRQAFTKYLDGRQDLSANYLHSIVRGTERHLHHLLDRSIGTITRTELLACLRILDDKGRHAYVRRILIWLNQVYRWAVENDVIPSNPASTIHARHAFGKSITRNMPALSARELPDFLRLVAQYSSQCTSYACMMLAYTWTRTIELRKMMWSEIDRDVWVIPADKMKMKRDHVVPLPRQALALLDKIRTLHNSEYVFPSSRSLHQPLSSFAILHMIAKLGYGGRMTGHGWRSVASTWANEQGYNPDAIERQLAHAPKNQVRGAYNRAEYMDIRRGMLQDWADWLDSLIQQKSNLLQG